MAFTYVTLQRTYETANDLPAAGSVDFVPVDQMRNGLTVVATPVTATLDSAGAISIRVAATTDPGTTPVGVTYKVVERILGQSARTYYVSVPHDEGATLQLADLSATSGTSGAAGYALRNATDYDDSVAPSDGQVMTWDGTTSKFHPEAVAGGGGAVSSVNGQTGAVTVTASGLGAQPVDSDLTTIAALAPADGSYLGRTSGVWAGRNAAQVKTDLALDQVNNTTDAAKPVSTATSTALALKANLASPTFTGTPAGPRFVTPAVSLTASGGVITPDASASSVFIHTAAGSVTLADPVNGVDGQTVEVRVYASGADRVLTAASVPYTIAAGTYWWGRYSYDGGRSVWVFSGSGSGGSGSYTDEQVRDVIGTALVAGSNVTITPNDGADTITIAAATSGASGIPASTVDAKGDLIAATANDTVARLGVGSDGQALVASSAATTGLTWAAPAPASHSHSAADVTSGTVATARLGSGTASSSTYLRGDQTWATVSGSGAGLGANTFTGDQRVNAGFGVNTAPSARQPVNMITTLNAGSMTGSADKVAFALGANFTGNFTGGTGSNPGFAWGLNLFATTGSNAGDGAGLTDIIGALIELSVQTPSGTTLPHVIGLQAEAAFFGATSGATVTVMESMRVSAPKRKDGSSSGTATNVYCLFIENPEAYNVGTSNSKFALFVEGGITRLQGPVTVDSVLQSHNGALAVKADYSGNGRIDMTTNNIGFFGVTPVARQTLPASGSVTAANIRTALIALGLCQ